MWLKFDEWVALIGFTFVAHSFNWSMTGNHAGAWWGTLLILFAVMDAIYDTD